MNWKLETTHEWVNGETNRAFLHNKHAWGIWKAIMISQGLSATLRGWNLAWSFYECCCLERVNGGALNTALGLPHPQEVWVRPLKVKYRDKLWERHLLPSWTPKNATEPPFSLLLHPLAKRQVEGRPSDAVKEARARSYLENDTELDSIPASLCHTISWDSQRTGTYFNNNCLCFTCWWLCNKLLQNLVA